MAPRRLVRQRGNSYVVDPQINIKKQEGMGEYRNGMKMKLVERTGSMQLEIYRCGPKNSLCYCRAQTLKSFRTFVSRARDPSAGRQHIMCLEKKRSRDPTHSIHDGDLNQPAAGGDATAVSTAPLLARE